MPLAWLSQLLFPGKPDGYLFGRVAIVMVVFGLLSSGYGLYRLGDLMR
jgi:hypothetical protein